MASAGTITVNVRINVRTFARRLNRATETVERLNARHSGTWNRFQMVGER